MSTAMAFSKASLVRICEGLRLFLISFRICLPVALANRSLNALLASEVAQYADGVIVGSAFIRLLQEAHNPQDGIAKVRALAQDLAKGLQRS